jgi:hypothetical protein
MSVSGDFSTSRVGCAEVAAAFTTDTQRTTRKLFTIGKNTVNLQQRRVSDQPACDTILLQRQYALLWCRWKLISYRLKEKVQFKRLNERGKNFEFGISRKPTSDFGPPYAQNTEQRNETERQRKYGKRGKHGNMGNRNK